MSFIKRGDGKILSVVLDEEEELTEDQKKLAKDLSKKLIRPSIVKADPSQVKKSGR